MKKNQNPIEKRINQFFSSIGYKDYDERKIKDFMNSLEQKYLTEDLILKLIPSYPIMTVSLPKDKYTESIAIMSVRYYSQFSKLIGNLPDSVKSDKFFIEAVERRVSLNQIPEEFMTPSLLWLYMNVSPSNLQYIPAHKQTDKLCLLAITWSGSMLKFVHRQSVDLCLKAIKLNKENYRYIKICENNTYEQTLNNLLNLKRIDENKASILQKINSL